MRLKISWHACLEYPPRQRQPGRRAWSDKINLALLPGLPHGEGALAVSDILVASSLINGNGTGVEDINNASTIRLSDADIISNGTAISGVSYSYVTNRIVGTTLGSAPTPLGSLSPTSGEQ
jgi:hypothetical protein